MGRGDNGCRRGRSEEELWEMGCGGGWRKIGGNGVVGVRRRVMAWRRGGDRAYGIWYIGG